MNNWMCRSAVKAVHHCVVDGLWRCWRCKPKGSDAGWMSAIERGRRQHIGQFIQTKSLEEFNQRMTLQSQPIESWGWLPPPPGQWVQKKNKGNKIKQYKNITLQMSPLQYMAFTPPPLSSNSPSHKRWNVRSFVHGSFWTLMTDIKMSVNSTHLKMQIFVFLQQHRDVSSMASIGKSQPLQPKYK